jgi:hypothetical protein
VSLFNGSHMDMDNPRDVDISGPVEARYLAFLETITHLRPSLHRYCSRMTGSVLDGEDVVQEALFQGVPETGELRRRASAGPMAVPHRSQSLTRFATV